jgi:hypothetical protein
MNGSPGVLGWIEALGGELVGDSVAWVFVARDAP